MNKLELWYPCRPLGFNQKYGLENTPVELRAKYKSYGLKGHNGIDFLAGHGTPIRASADGVVIFVGYDGDGGLGIEVLHEVGKEFYKTLYWHLKTGSTVVTVGQQVKTGDLLGLADNTGLSTGDHLHFGLKRCAPKKPYDTLDYDNGYKGAIDPIPYFNGYFAEDKNKVISTLENVIALLKKILGQK